MTGSHISSPEISTCPTESMDEEVYCAGTISRFSIVALSILKNLAIRKRSGATIVAQNCHAIAVTIGVVLSHKRHAT